MHLAAPAPTVINRTGTRGGTMVGEAIGALLPGAPAPVVTSVARMTAADRIGPGRSFGSGTLAGSPSTDAVTHERVEPPFGEPRGRLTGRDAMVMSVLLLVMGGLILGQGVAGL